MLIWQHIGNIAIFNQHCWNGFNDLAGAQNIIAADHKSITQEAHLEVCAQLHEVCHVDLVEGCEHGIGILSTFQPLCYTCS